MRPGKASFLVSLLAASCLVPDVEVVPDSDPDDAAGSSHSGKSSTSTAGKASSPRGGSDSVGEGGSGAVGEGGGGSDGPDGPSNPGSRSGSGNGGSNSPTAGTGTVGPTPPAESATGKFCNYFYYGGSGLNLSLTVGTGSKKRVFYADSGTCTPISGLACQSIPLGPSVPLSVSDGFTEYASDSTAISNGDAWIFLVTYDETTDTMALSGGPVTKSDCEAGLDSPAPQAPAPAP